MHYMVPILSGVPFGCAVSQIMQGISQYLMDAYSIHCASALAATVVLRSLFGAVFPLFSPAMFKALGDQWAVSVFGFIALVGTPLPVLFFVRDVSFSIRKGRANINFSRNMAAGCVIEVNSRLRRMGSS